VQVHEYPPFLLRDAGLPLFTCPQHHLYKMMFTNIKYFHKMCKHVRRFIFFVFLYQKEPTMLTVQNIASMIDHSLLNPAFTDTDIRNGCALAAAYKTATVCVRPTDLKLAAEILKGTQVLPTTVIGFPHGSNRTEVKVFEAGKAIDDGALELDMVINIGKMLSGEYAYVEQDVNAVCDYAHKQKVIVKVIFENCYLTDEQKITACRLCAHADFIKTSTGYGTGGATAADLILFKAHARPGIRIKAAGGIRTLDAALAVRKLGAERFGATATKAILEEAQRRFELGELAEWPEGAEIVIGGGY
jgi:deoxyribose-phosphate aldolase